MHSSVEFRHLPRHNRQTSIAITATQQSNAQPPTVATRRSKRMRQIQDDYTGTEDCYIPRSASTLPAPTECHKCGATKFAFEPRTFCCSDGKVHIARNDFPSEILELFGGTDAKSIHFRKYARMYNNMFAFSSLGGSIHAESKKGIYIFSLQGQIYHFIPALLPQNNNPAYMQLYFYDAQEESVYRAGLFPEINHEIVHILMHVMRQNPYAKFFRSLREMGISENTKFMISHNPTLDQRIYNAPSSDDVAAVIVESNSSHNINSPHILVHGKDNISHRIMHYYGCYDPLQYPLLHPLGESGWHQNVHQIHSTSNQLYTNHEFPTASQLFQDPTSTCAAHLTGASGTPSTNQTSVSCRQYYAYKLQMRPGNHLLKAGRLFQQYVVDMYVKIENTRLDYLRQNQTTIRAELYQGILDSLHMGHTTASDIGHRTVLPPSFIGGPRDVKRRYLNAMTLVQKFGKPDLFITITCNPNWPEIQERLGPGEKAEDRPDIIARVFHGKLIMLKNAIIQKKLFGPVAARVDVIEFQKRGLPHAHILIILERAHKISSPEQFDQYVCAEIPSCENPHLRTAVLRHMIHGPCGPKHPNCACMKRTGNQSSCRHKYPKRFAEFTTCGEDSYPVYKRRNHGEKLRIRGEWLDNRSVIPYNPYLLALFDCHINVEICSTITAVKYLYKYIYKGHDCVSFNIIQGSINANDEISSYQNARWVSPPEAAWRIFGFDLYDIQPPVIPLQVHLPNMQPIAFHPHENLVEIATYAHRSRTMLTEFFICNNVAENAEKYLYSEYPEHYVWHPSEKKWTARKRKHPVGRLAYAGPSEGERYYLRLLLSHVHAPKSFKDLLTVNAYECKTFQEAAQKRGLLETDGYADSCMQEASEVQMPPTLRRLFATLLVFCEPADPLTLWLKYYRSLSEDFEKKHSPNRAKILHLTVQDIESYLEAMGKTLKAYNLHELSQAQDTTITITKDIGDALTAPIPTEYINAHKRLNREQHTAYKCIMQHIKSNTAGAFFIDGPGGTGKTFLYCALYAKLRSLGKIVLPTATSGIAASNIPTGRTAHSRFKIPFDEEISATCNVSKQSSLAQLIKQTSLIIWDEASMARKENIESLDLLLQDICDSKQLFGGKIIVFGGDFRQVLPVLPKKTQHEAINASLVSSYIWPHLTKLRLTQNMRAKEDPNFSDFLLELGNGKLQHEEHAYINLPPSITMNCNEGDDDFQILANTVFPEMRSSPQAVQIYNERAILTPTNDSVDRINAALIENFVGPSVTYHSFDSIVDDNCNTFPTDFLNTLCPAGMSPHKLVLKENCPVILLRNLDPSSGLCNGTRLICTRFLEHVIQCEISTGYYKGQQIFLPRITLRPPSGTKYPFHFQRKQFPIKLCFAMTINKAQGQTLDKVVIYLKQPCFSHGQLYVALSRARKEVDVKVLTNTPEQHHDQPVAIQNIVSFEMLRRAEII